MRSVVAGLGYLARAQHPTGSWTDFWVPGVGTSDAWVTAYVGLALAAVEECPFLYGAACIADARGAARRAAEWLCAHQRPYPGWGYNANVPVDADSTAHGVSLFARLRLGVPRGALDVLRRHEEPGKGFRTYAWSDPEHEWGRPCADVTAAVLRALHDAGELDEIGVRLAWQETLGAIQDERGWWHGYWWPTPTYATGLALEVWHAAGCPPLRAPVDVGLPTECAFDRAWAVRSRSLWGDLPGAALIVDQLLASQEGDGSWPDAPILQVPPSYKRPGHAGSTVFVRDARRLFSTASAVRALVLVGAALPILVEHTTDQFRYLPSVITRPVGDRPPVGSTIGRGCQGASRSDIGQTLDTLVQRVAAAVGLGAAAACRARVLFSELTRESLGAPCVWPALQLSTLAAGLPLEFSATVGPRTQAALRYAAEVGDPTLAPYCRARSAVAAVARSARSLGYVAAWKRVLPAVGRLVSPHLPVPDGLRFWVWSGVDQIASMDDESPRPPSLKVYLNMLNQELGHTRERLEEALGAARIPVVAHLRQALDWLDEAGFVHQLGFGLGPDGKIACKVYYELGGWHRLLVRRILEHAGLPVKPDAVRPEIPGVLLESLAVKRRAGIALRIEPKTGAIREVTIATAFPPPLLPAAESTRRIQAWIDSHGWEGRVYQALVAELLSTREEDAPRPKLHSLFTRTLSHNDAWSTIYLRPPARFP